ncbi:ABC-2 type transporter [Geobacter metallireducens RCH3]|uniref:ABC transporter, membrane protein n=1 Tax=Geobacter metallireducens (strain ATCC 53774 / DSM 7210 / GS-15) TaxID=269799 RepID=Q39XX6_GEOMG|nr:ABC transporter permease [Geobacter metallireducens]ABB30898.1 ABC transporter, membrane protein [Geobacter metallireducens GS-15]EHP84793.1 ABC-2 type transporter [Geobacter metallireducens RCH3]
MKLQRVAAVARKEFIHVFRDPRSLGMGIAIPMLLLFLFGYALTLDVDRVPLMVWDQSATPESRDFISHFAGSRYFTLAGRVGTYREIEIAIDRRDVLMALVIPTDFARKVRTGMPAPVQLILDGSDSNTATIALGYAEAVTSVWAREVVLEQTRRFGPVPAAGSVDVRPRVWFNTDMVSRNYIFPGLIAVIMMVIAALLTSLTVAREWETGTMEQLITTPLRGAELIVGKLIPYFAIGILDLVLSVLVGEFVFDIPLRGSLWLLFAMSLIFLTCALAFGLLISIVTKNQRLASQTAMVTTMLPAFLLSGFIFPIENMPPPIQAVTHIITARYFVTILRDIYLKGVGLGVLAPEAAFLAVFGVVVLALAVKKFRKKVE